MSEEIIVTKDNINTDANIETLINESVAELLKELHSGDNALYKEMISLIHLEKNLIELQNFLILLETVFAKFVFDLKFEAGKWHEIEQSIGKLKKKHKPFNKLIDLYLIHINLDEINPGISKNKNLKTKNEIKDFLLGL